ncbi:unnamed protein product, partial [Scytosiphon promiscuus]
MRDGLKEIQAQVSRFDGRWKADAAHHPFSHRTRFFVPWRERGATRVTHRIEWNVGQAQHCVRSPRTFCSRSPSFYDVRWRINFLKLGNGQVLAIMSGWHAYGQSGMSP